MERQDRTKQFLLTSLMLGCVLTIHAQTTSGSITGRITDTTGGTIAGAEIRLTNTATGLTRDAKSDAQGLYLFTNLPAGVV